MRILEELDKSPELSSGTAEQVAARMLARFNLVPGCDARDLAFSIGLAVSRHRAPTRIRRGALYYDERLHLHDRNIAICRVLGELVLGGRGHASAADLALFVRALTRSSSGTMTRVG